MSDSTRSVRIVFLCAALALLLPAIALYVSFHEFGFYPHGLGRWRMLLVFSMLPYVIAFLLRGTGRTAGAVALLTGWSLAALFAPVLGIMGLPTDIVIARSGEVMGMAVVFAWPVHIVAIFAGLRALAAMRRNDPQAPGWSVILTTALGGIVFLGVLFTATPHRGINGGESWAAGSLRTINTAELSYASTYSKSGSGYSRSLAQLGQGGEASAQHANLIDAALASGERSGYRIIYTPGPANAVGEISSYHVVARPVTYDVTGRRSFYTDQTAIIRSTQDDREPSAADPPLE